jgi:hypothetical protein
VAPPPASYASTGYGAGQQATATAAPVTEYAPGIGKIASAAPAAAAARGAQASAPSLAAARARIAKELEDPETRRLLKASTMAEVGGMGEKSELAYVESVMNRALARGDTLSNTVRGLGKSKGYYPWMTTSKLGKTSFGTADARFERHIQSALGGSNISNLATGNESGGVVSGGAGGRNAAYNPGSGERFVRELHSMDQAWVKAQDRAMKASTTTPPVAATATAPATPITPPVAGSSLKNVIQNPTYQQKMGGSIGGTNVASSPVSVTVNGQTDPKEVGTALRTAMKQRDTELLESLKSARNAEARRAYV